MRYVFPFLAAMLLSASAFAADLTDKDVQHWISAYKSVVQWSKTQDKKDLEFMEKQRKPNVGNLFSGSIDAMKDHKIYSDFSAVLKKSGYDNPQEWAQQGDRIVSATMALELEKRHTTSAEARAQVQQALQMLRNNPNMPPEQKAQMMQMMSMSNQMLNVAENVPQADKDAVKRNADAIKAIMQDGHKPPEQAKAK